MTATALGARVAGVQVALIFYQQMNRLEGFVKLRFDGAYAINCHGNTGLNGLTVTLL